MSREEESAKEGGGLNLYFDIPLDVLEGQGGVA
jgi:hypothetical protein